MATHRDDAGEPGATNYPGQGYPGSGYPSSSTGYPSRATDPTAERRYAERIPRYPDAGRADEGPPEPPAAPPQQPPQPPQQPPQQAQQPQQPYQAQQAPASQQIPAQAAPSTHQGQQAPPGPAQGGAPQPPVDEDLRLVGGDLPNSRPPDPPTAAYQVMPRPTAGPPPEARAPQPPRPPEQPPAGRPGPLAEMLNDSTQHTEPVTPYPPAAGTSAPPTGNARSQLAWGLALATIVLEVPVAIVLVRSLIGPGIVVSGVVASLFLLPGLPLFAAGVYQLFTGRIVARPGDGIAALVRRPLATLLLGIVLLIAAGLAAG